jgi:hypothetical protein
MEQRDAVLGRDGQTQGEPGSSKASAMLDALRVRQSAGGPPQPEQGHDEKAAPDNSATASPAETAQEPPKIERSAQEPQPKADQPQDGVDPSQRQQGKSKRGR